MTRNEFSTTDLNVLHQQLTAWRRRQPGRGRLPETVWKSAAALARSQGVSQVSRLLRLDYYKLSRCTAERTQPPAEPSPSATFVEVALSEASGPTARSGYRAEVRDGTAATLTLHLGRDVDAVVAVVQAFGRRGR
jgi:hypothetical protein